MDVAWVWPLFGVFAILQAIGAKMKNPLVLVILFLLGPFGFLYAYFFLSPPPE